MDTFIDALLSGKTDRIPDEYDWFAPLLGDWDCDYYDEPEPGRKRHVRGEWIFRMFNKVEHCYDVVYTCDHAMKRLCFTKQGDRLVGKVLSEENAYWIFSDITPDSFRWENVRIKENGEKFQLCEIFGKRIG